MESEKNWQVLYNHKHLIYSPFNIIYVWMEMRKGIPTLKKQFLAAVPRPCTHHVCSTGIDREQPQLKTHWEIEMFVATRPRAMQRGRKHDHSSPFAFTSVFQIKLI